MSNSHLESSMEKNVFIPISHHEYFEYVTVDTDNLPVKAGIVADVLESELAPLDKWLEIALEYLNRGNEEQFKSTLQSALSKETLAAYDNSIYEKYQRDGAQLQQARQSINQSRVSILNALAAFYTNKLISSEGPEQKRFYQDAYQYFQQSDQLDSHQPLTWIGKGMLVAAQNDDKKDGSEMISNAYEFVSKDKNVVAILAQARSKYAKEKYKESIQLYTTALLANPNLPADVRVGFGLCYFQLNDFTRASAAFERALQLDPMNTDAMVALAVINLNNARKYLKAGKSEAAKQCNMQCWTYLQKCINLEPTNPIALIYLSDLLFYSSNLDLCLSVLLKAEALATSEFSKLIHAEIYYRLARLYHSTGDVQQAFTYYSNCVAKNPEHYLAHMGYGQLNIGVDNDKALASLKKVQKQYPDDVEVQRIYGSLLDMLDQAKEATDELQKAVEQNPHSKDAVLELALVSKSTNPSLSLSSFLKFIELWHKQEILKARKSKNRGKQEMSHSVGGVGANGNDVNGSSNSNAESIEINVLPRGIWNNCGALAHKLRKFEDAQMYYLFALLESRCSTKTILYRMETGNDKKISIHLVHNRPVFSLQAVLEASIGDSSNSNSNSTGTIPLKNVTTLYNLALMFSDSDRATEALLLCDAILKDAPQYLECEILKSVIMAKQGDVKTASDKLLQVFTSSGGVLFGENKDKHKDKEQDSNGAEHSASVAGLPDENAVVKLNSLAQNSLALIGKLALDIGDVEHLQKAHRCFMMLLKVKKSDSPSSASSTSAAPSSHASDKAKKDDAYARVALGNINYLLARSAAAAEARLSAEDMAQCEKLRKVIQENDPAKRASADIIKQAEKKSKDIEAKGAARKKELRRESEKYFKKAGSLFKMALQDDKDNVFAANGISVVMAKFAFIKEAKDGFMQTKIACSGAVADVWVNIGHIFSQSENYAAAAQMYINAYNRLVQDEGHMSFVPPQQSSLSGMLSIDASVSSSGSAVASASRASNSDMESVSTLFTAADDNIHSDDYKFTYSNIGSYTALSSSASTSTSSSTSSSSSSLLSVTTNNKLTWKQNVFELCVLQYIAHSYYSNKMHSEAKRVLMKTLVKYPNSYVSWYNLAITCEHFAEQVIKMPFHERTLNQVKSAVYNFQQAQSIFTSLAEMDEATLNSTTLGKYTIQQSFVDPKQAKKHAEVCKNNVAAAKKHQEQAEIREKDLEEKSKLLKISLEAAEQKRLEAAAKEQELIQQELERQEAASKAIMDKMALFKSTLLNRAEGYDDQGKKGKKKRKTDDELDSDDDDGYVEGENHNPDNDLLYNEKDVDVDDDDDVLSGSSAPIKSKSGKRPGKKEKRSKKTKKHDSDEDMDDEPIDDEEKERRKEQKILDQKRMKRLNKVKQSSAETENDNENESNDHDNENDSNDRKQKVAVLADDDAENNVISAQNQITTEESTRSIVGSNGKRKSSHHQDALDEDDAIEGDSNNADTTSTGSLAKISSLDTNSLVESVGTATTLKSDHVGTSTSDNESNSVKASNSSSSKRKKRKIEDDEDDL